MARWLSDLQDSAARARIVSRLDRLKAGLPGDWRSVGEGVCELRIDSGPGYRVYYAQDGEALIILLCGGDKRTQRADIRQAIKLAEDWQQQGKAKPTAQPKASKKR